jgi:hypothetical protein
VPGFDMSTGADLIEELTGISVAAATAILASSQDGEFRVKDGSPVTRAGSRNATGRGAALRRGLRASPRCTAEPTRLKMKPGLWMRSGAQLRIIAHDSEESQKTNLQASVAATLESL